MEFSSKSPTTYLGAICIANKPAKSFQKGGGGGPDPLDIPPPPVSAPDDHA